ncbi:MAG: hypothetical protein MUC88_00465 [Planctomycetes bacterium]|jgi:hypothetical protein|nr:hypothetical protein [Planctomycetota bacterium]
MFLGRQISCAVLALLLVSPAFRSAPAMAAADARLSPTSQPVTKPVPASQPSEPKDIGEATGAVKDAIAAAKGGQWWYLSAVIIMLAMFGLKTTKLLEKMGRWKYVVSPVLSLTAALLATFQGGLTFEAAAGVFATGWATGMLEELVNHGILGKPHTTNG